MDIRKVILIIMLFIFAITLVFPGANVTSQKRCSSDEDCGFVRTVCCPGCSGGFDSVNVKYADSINSEMNIRCNDTECPPLFCESDYGSAYTTAPKCTSHVCVSESKLQCNAVCSYYEKRDRAPFKIYLKNTAELENKSISKLALDCEC